MCVVCIVCVRERVRERAVCGDDRVCGMLATCGGGTLATSPHRVWGLLATSPHGV